MRSFSYSGIHTCTFHDRSYPKLLKEIPDPPDVIYIKGMRGRIPIPLEKTIAVVGSREMTEYGRRTTKKFVQNLVENGYTIISGLARGVDACAHETALECKGFTVAVLGCGVDILYPQSNACLYERIISSGRGAVISEFAPGVITKKDLFITRNRIISGLSLGVLVIEGSMRSGTMITAKYAAEQGRDVFAVPGSVDSPMSNAPITLMKNGAIPVSSARDILDIYEADHC